MRNDRHLGCAAASNHNESDFDMASPFILPSGSKSMPLTRGLYAIVDDEDYEFLMQWRWYATGSGYAARNMKAGERGKIRGLILMHRVINQTPDHMQTDHIDGDRLNNKKENLRSVTSAQNHFNNKPRSGTSSKYKGVCWDNHKKQWMAYIGINKKFKNLGHFKCESEAALAYNEAAKLCFGEFARPNLIEPKPV